MRAAVEQLKKSLAGRTDARAVSMLANADWLIRKSVWLIGGESADPCRVKELVCGEIARLQKEGIDEKAFARSKKAVYGRYVRMLNRPDSIANAMTGTHFAGLGIYDLVEAVAAATPEQIEARLREDYRTEYSSLSVISPLE